MASKNKGVFSSQMENARYLCEYLPRLGKVNGCVEAEAFSNSMVPKLTQTSVILGGFSLNLPSTVDQSQNLNWKSAPGGVTFALTAPQVIEDTSGHDSYPWTAKEVAQANADFKCQKCSKIIIHHDKVQKVHPMPSELWSEMMEFWHCHKPNQGEEFLNQKISKRFNSFSPRRYNVLVGSYYLIINPSDWELGEDLKCSCGAVLGEMDSNLNNFKLFKWKLKWDQGEPFNAYNYVTLRLLDEISSTGVRFYILKAKDRESLLLWCFNTDIQVTTAEGFYNNCLKVLYKIGPEVDQFVKDQELVGLHRYSTLEVEWGTVFDDAVAQIERTHASLPSSQAIFNGWLIGYIN